MMEDMDYWEDMRYNKHDEDAWLNLYKWKAIYALRRYVTTQELWDEAKELYTQYILEDTILQKSRKPYPLGTVREWKSGEHIKIAADAWKPFSNAGRLREDLEAILNKIDEAESIEQLRIVVKHNEDKFPANYMDVFSLLDILGELKPVIKEAKETGSSIIYLIFKKGLVWNPYRKDSFKFLHMTTKEILRYMEEEVADSIDDDVRYFDLTVLQCFCAAWSMVKHLVPSLPKLNEFRIETEPINVVARLRYSRDKKNYRQVFCLTPNILSATFIMECALNRKRQELGRLQKTVIRRDCAFIDAFLHEMGHIVIRSLEAEVYNNMIRSGVKLSGKVDVFKYMTCIGKSFRLSNNEGSYPSVYSSRSESEYFAECFCLYMTRPGKLKPHQRAMILEVINKLNRLESFFLFKSVLETDGNDMLLACKDYTTLEIQRSYNEGGLRDTKDFETRDVDKPWWGITNYGSFYASERNQLIDRRRIWTRMQMGWWVNDCDDDISELEQDPSEELAWDFLQHKMALEPKLKEASTVEEVMNIALNSEWPMVLY